MRGDLARPRGLHFLQPPRASAATLRACYTLASVRSKRRRAPAQARILDEQGHRARVFELQGDLRFATLEPVLRQIVDAGTTLLFAVLDFKRVSNADPAATRMLASLVDGCAERGQQVVLTRVRRGGLLADFGSQVHPRGARAVTFQPQLDLGLEWCERALLERFGATISEPERNRENPYCCGAGGGLLFADKEEVPGSRISDVRLGQLQATGATTVVTACPFCSIMLKGAQSSAPDAANVQFVDLMTFVRQRDGAGSATHSKG